MIAAEKFAMFCVSHINFGMRYAHCLSTPFKNSVANVHVTYFVRLLSASVINLTFLVNRRPDDARVHHYWLVRLTILQYVRGVVYYGCLLVNYLLLCLTRLRLLYPRYMHLIWRETRLLLWHALWFHDTQICLTWHWHLLTHRWLRRLLPWMLRLHLLHLDMRSFIDHLLLLLH